jgi:uncharacterized membrane protein (DUF485 family)
MPVDAVGSQGNGRESANGHQRELEAAAAHEKELDALASERFKFGGMLSLVMMAIYFAFILLVAFEKTFLDNLITDGLSVGIVLGVLVILSTWALTLIYVRWANRVYEPRVRQLRR